MFQASQKIGKPAASPNHHNPRTTGKYPAYVKGIQKRPVASEAAGTAKRHQKLDQRAPGE